MARGILSGIGLGAVFSVGVAGVVSVLVPIEPQRAPELGTAETIAPPQPTVPQATVTVTDSEKGEIGQPQVSLRAPAGEELPKEPTGAARAPQVASALESMVEQPQISPDRVAAPTQESASVASAPEQLSPVGSDTAPQAPAPLPQPQTGSAANLTVPRPLPEGVAVRVEDDAPVLPNPQALAPMIPDDSPDSEIVEQDTAAAVPTQEQEGEETLVVVEPAPAQTPDSDAQEEPAQDPETASVPPVKPRIVTVPGSQTNTIGTTARPRVGTPANTLINRSATDDDTAVETVTQSVGDTAHGTPLHRYAQPFENPEGKPLMSIVLMDTGTDLDAAEIGLPALSSFPYPISVAIDMRLPDAAKRMERYRAEGFDVLAMVDLPSGARPTDAEVTMSVALNGLPEIVGVLEGTGEGLQGSREVADQVTGILKASGHGLVTQNRGLNSMPKLAVKEGVPAAPVFRDFDSQGQKARVIRRFLDQAAFKAGQEGGVIMLGRLRPETIEALVVWGLADRAGSVALAPVSATLLAQK
ncbi:divergent polysaccharide deacetylase family protein [Sulfitobacter sp. F26169L]|uniref:divergent polysaccharide deacetylase family protein n=1 Tax=Sulfitobacter sp. F26169L TaxID=2996015 RepID=UPI0022609E74|nr:polysaccharide deacteylase family 2 protein [Sulfitobacter sp. F26169L]MCX7566172.1 divergent polysaccharide deacetylase family protein [Sulfitobacter sp. F26169L]